MNSMDIVVPPEQDPRDSALAFAGRAANAADDDRINILLVDDERKNLTVLETILDDPGYRLVCAESAHQALLALVNEEFALIVLDIQMPDMSGFELAQMIKQRRRTAQVPIIFLTAHYSEDQHVVQGYETGAVDYLHKPVNSFILRSKVAVFANLYRLTRESVLAQKVLLAEMTERRRIQDQLHELNQTLEQRVAERTLELSRANDALSESEGRLRLAQHAGQVGIWDWNLQTGEGSWSEAARQVLEILDDATQTTVERWLAQVHPEDRQRVADRFFEARSTGDYRDEYRVICSDVRPKWVESVGAVEYQDSEPVRMCGAVRDIAERKEMELELHESNRRKDQFLAMLSHELRNPLAAIRNAVSIFEQVPLYDANLNWCREVLDRQVRQLTRLVDDLLDVTRVSRGKIQLQKERLDLSLVVQHAVESCRPLIQGRGHALKITLPTAPLCVEGDYVRLTQVVGNLLSNAAKYTDSGGTISVILEASSELPRQAVLRVRDNGSGIGSDAMKNLFEMFYQADHNLNRSDGGLGIGLSLVRSLVQMHGGQVEACSPGPGQGSEFIIRLPSTEESVPMTNPSESQTTATRPSGVKMLVVDDNQDSARSMGLLLEIMGHDVLLAHNGRQAVEMALLQQPEVVLLDIGLPEIDGYQACREMRQGGLTQQLIIAMTGYGRQEDRNLSEQAGFDCHLVKPVNVSEIAALLSTRKLLPASQ